MNRCVDDITLSRLSTLVLCFMVCQPLYYSKLDDTRLRLEMLVVVHSTILYLRELLLPVLAGNSRTIREPSREKSGKGY